MVAGLDLMPQKDEEHPEIDGKVQEDLPEETTAERTRPVSEP